MDKKQQKKEELIKKANQAWLCLAQKIFLKNRLQETKPWGYFNLTPSRSQGRKVPLIYINTVGCFHKFKGGCTMCDLGYLNNRIRVSQKQIKNRFVRALDFAESNNKNYEHGIFNINACGSFFDQREVPLKIREYVLKRIASNKKRHKRTMFVTESRLEFINKELLEEVRSILGYDTEIKVGFGIESTNDIIREACVNKGLPKDYRDKLKLIKKYNIKRDAHVIFKPPFLTEKEAIGDVVNSVKELFRDNLSDFVVIMTMNLKPMTFLKKLEKEGLYKLPSIWSVIEIIKRLGPDACQHIFFNGFITDRGSSVKIVKGCDYCSPLLMPKILNFNRPNKKQWRELIKFSKSISCPCKIDWKKEMNRQNKTSIESRIISRLNLLSLKYLNKKVL